MFESLKLIDIYKVDKKFNVSDESEDKNEFLNQDKVGSKVGGTFSAMLYSIVLYQLVSQMYRMHQGTNDN